MKIKKQFSLSPKFCSYNSIAVMSQEGSRINFIMEHFEDEGLKEIMRKSFRNYLRDLEGFSAFSENSECDMRVTFTKGSYDEVRSYISKLYNTSVADDAASSCESRTDGNAQKILSSPDDDAANDSAAEILLDTLISDACKKMATDIHIENNTVRFRICGNLVNVMELQEDRSRELVQRIKLLARMNVLENRKSQDGQFVYGLDKNIFVRVSCVGAVGAKDGWRVESVVMRLLDPKRVPLSIDTLGMNQNQCIDLKNIYSQKNGLVLICGPTGSGKSTTAAAMLLEIQKEFGGTKKIISIEDPPEYVLPNVTQICVEQGGAVDFSSALVSIFRQDPDVIFIGEIRDENSAQTAVQAALTGHLVFATLHTYGAAGAIQRMCNFGVNQNCFLSVLRGVISQELVYDNTAPQLYADVAIPLHDLNKIVTPASSADEIENGFSHSNNAVNYLLKSVRRLSQPSWKKSLRIHHERQHESVMAGA